MATAEVEVAEVEEPGEPETPDVEEPEEPEEPAQPTDPEEPEEQDAPPMSEADLEKAMKALDKEATRHANRVSEIMGEDAQALIPCPLCPENLPGFIFAGDIPDDTRAAVLQVLNPVELPAMQQEPGIEVCDICNGYGEALTGSLVPGKDRKLCGKCNGNGWTTQNDRAAWTTMHPPAMPTLAAVPAPPPATPIYDGLPATDAYGRPAGNIFYGMDPQYMTAEQRQSDPWSPK